MEEANEHKQLKYQELVEQCQRNGWRGHCEPLEVGCRGFAAHSLCKAYTPSLEQREESHQLHHRGRGKGLKMDLDKKV